MQQRFDITVIGAGPAGSTAALNAAIAGKTVCLLERNEQPGVPVRCGEGIGLEHLASLIDIQQKWIRQYISKSEMISPDGTRVFLSDIDKSVILDRVLFDGDLAKKAVMHGTQLFVKTPVTSISRDPEGNYICHCPEGTFISKLVIIADGVESRAARSLGWNTMLSADDIESCAFTRVVSQHIKQDTCIFYVGSQVAPGGYAWIFPRGDNEANVGLGINGSHCSPGKPQKALLDFINHEIPGSKIDTIHYGGVPVTHYIRPLVKDGAILVGDAARQVNCLSGAGIGYALYAGGIAGKIAAEALNDEYINFNHLKNYEKQWKKKYGRQQERSYILKEFLVHHTDDQFLNRIADKLSKKNGRKTGLLAVFLTAFSRHPLLMFKAFKLFG